MRGLLAPAPLGKVFTLQPEEKISFFPLFSISGMGVDGKLFFAPQKTAVPYCRRPGSATANVRQGHRSTANPSTLTRLFCRIRDRGFAMGPVTRIEMLTNHLTVRFGQRHAVVWGDAVAHAGARQKSYRFDGSLESFEKLGSLGRTTWLEPARGCCG